MSGMPTKILYRWIAIGAAVFAGLAIAVGVVFPSFPDTSSVSMAFFGVGTLALCAGLVASAVRVLMKIPARFLLTRWTRALVLSRLSIICAVWLSLMVAIIGSIIERQLARPLWHMVLVEIVLGAFWLIATAAAANIALCWSNVRDNPQIEPA